jgi:hypothetical protein
LTLRTKNRVFGKKVEKAVCLCYNSLVLPNVTEKSRKKKKRFCGLPLQNKRRKDK